MLDVDAAKIPLTNRLRSLQVRSVVPKIGYNSVPTTESPLSDVKQNTTDCYQ